MSNTMDNKVKHSTNEKDYKEYGAKIASDLIPNSEDSISIDEAIEEFQKSEYADKI